MNQGEGHGAGHDDGRVEDRAPGGSEGRHHGQQDRRGGQRLAARSDAEGRPVAQQGKQPGDCGGRDNQAGVGGERYLRGAQHLPDAADVRRERFEGGAPGKPVGGRVRVMHPELQRGHADQPDERAEHHAAARTTHKSHEHVCKQGRPQHRGQESRAVEEADTPCQGGQGDRGRQQLSRQ